MTIFLIKKEKRKTYKSEDMVFAVSGKKLFHDEKGAPYLDEGCISVTDTKNYWACALSDVPIGIDMEELSRPVSSGICKKLHPAEREYLAPLQEGSREWKEEFLSIWTKKESYIKLMGKGLSFGLNKFCVLKEWEDTLETDLYNLIYKGLVFGATQPIEISEFKYSAPMEKSALEAGADILDMFGCSAKTLKDKLLSRGYEEGEVDAAVAKLLDLGFLNDSEYGRSLARKYAAKGYSSKRIELELKKKGLSSGDARIEASEYKEGDRERAMEAALKLKLPAPLDQKQVAKTVRKLSSLGYDTYLVYDIIQKLNNY